MSIILLDISSIHVSKLFWSDYSPNKTILVT